MVRSVLVPALSAAIGAVAATLVISSRAQNDLPVYQDVASPSHVESSHAVNGIGRPISGRYQPDVEGRLRLLETGISAAVAEQHRLAEELAAIQTQLAMRSNGADENATAAIASPAPPATSEVTTDVAVKEVGSDSAKSAMVRALETAGLDPATAADIKRRHDEIALNEIYLRDQATREQWLNGPRFAEEMAAIDAERTPIRAEIGDDAYDRYLFALGETNRVRVDDVLVQSPAAQVGLQAGDLILRYGDVRLFTPGELVDETRSGTAGEVVRLMVNRNGERFEVEVPRGPLGLRVAAAHGAPEAS